LAAVEITPESLDFLELTGRFGEKNEPKDCSQCVSLFWMKEKVNQRKPLT
jgi:hypothetical protein